MKHFRRKWSLASCLVPRERGSAVLFALFACMVAVVCVHVLTATVICGQRALADESSGRELLAATDASLAALCHTACADWTVAGWTSYENERCTVAGRLVEVEEPSEWTLGAEVKEVPLAPLGATLALVERGRDGLDLPMAAVVSLCVRCGASRTSPWLVDESAVIDEEEGLDPTEAAVDDAGAFAYVGGIEGEGAVGEGCAVKTLEDEWNLGDGWRAFLGAYESPTSRVVILEGATGEFVYVPDGVELSVPETPALVVVVGGATVDLRGAGEVWGVFVSDEGAVLLDGTVVHGAIFATECVDVGVSGQVVFDESVVRWACDRSLTRVRLVPGSRVEGVEEAIE